MKSPKKETSPLIVVVGYGRHVSLKRLLDSLRDAHYPHDVGVIVSLDGGYNEKAYEVAKVFESKFDRGSVEVVARDENIGRIYLSRKNS